MSRFAIHFLFGLGIFFAIGGCSAFHGRCVSDAGLNTDESQPSLGYLEHRGRRYEVRDLMDPRYRADNDDPFIRNFAPRTILADRSNNE